MGKRQMICFMNDFIAGANIKIVEDGKVLNDFSYRVEDTKHIVKYCYEKAVELNCDEINIKGLNFNHSSYILKDFETYKQKNYSIKFDKIKVNMI